VLDHQKLIEGAVKLNLQPGNIYSLLTDIHAGYRYEAVSKGLTFELDLQESLAQSNYLIDALRFNQVITNLVVNAIKFTESGSVKLTARMEKDRSNTLQVSVTDSGIGIHPENLQMIKDRFYQEPNRNSASEAGYGLGLSIVKQLVDLFGGTLEVSSEPGCGSQFEVFLPLIPAKTPEHQPPGHQNQWPRLDESYSILHIEDDPSTLLLVSHILETTPSMVVQTSSFEEATSLLENERFDLIISDLMLNKRTLDSELSKIRTATQIPLILVSAFEPARMKAISAYYLQKPFEQLDLKNLTIILLGQKEYNYPYLKNIYQQYDYQPEKIKNFLSILQEEFDSYITRFEKVFETRDLKEWEAILHKLTTHIKSLRLAKLSNSIPKSPSELDEDSIKTIRNGLLYCLCVFRYESTCQQQTKI
jgi:CheY-like chemotaxis protein/anti-sigma regulatory factor (Ser/Thr protein kinase)